MKIPKKIFPDRIVDAIVEIKYTLNQPFEVALGMFYAHIDDTYSYTSRPQNNNNKLVHQSNQFAGNKFEIQLGLKPIFYNDKIKIEITQGSIIFNCLNEYIGWENYIQEINQFLTQITAANLIQAFNRIGIRYISHYPQIQITEFTKFMFSFGLPELKSDSFSFHSEYNVDDYKVILNFNNNISIFKADETGNILSTPTSVIDIDVIKENLEETNLQTLIVSIEKAHSKEKEIFFALLNDSFLKSLNPEY